MKKPAAKSLPSDRATKVKTTIVTSPRAVNTAKVIQAIAIKPSPLPAEVDGQTTFQMTYVNTNGRQVYQACTQQVFKQIQDSRLTFDHRNNFRLRLAGDSKTIQSIDRFPKPELNTIFKAVGEEDTNLVVFQRHKDDTFTLKSQPAETPASVVDEISELLHANPEADADDYLDGKFKVDSITKKGGAVIIHVDPTER
jgi:hypothetical protein